MSHMAVIVITDTPDQLEIQQKLIPFCENVDQIRQLENQPFGITSDKLNKIIQFENTEPEYLEKYQTKTQPRVVLEDGSTVSLYNERFRNPDWRSDERYIVPDHLEQIEVAHKDHYPTFEAFMLAWCDDKRDEQGRYGYYHNVQGKWDWYQLGGRYSERLHAKPNTSGIKGKRSWGMEKIPVLPNKYDQMLKGEIDFDAMLAHKRQEHGKWYDDWHKKVMESIDSSDFAQGMTISQIHSKAEALWSEARAYDEQLGENVTEEERATARAMYDKSREWSHLLHSFDIELDKLAPNFNRQEYIDSAIPLSGWAIVKDGEWIESGSMRGWGMSSDNKDPKEWSKIIGEILSTVRDDQYIAIVD